MEAIGIPISRVRPEASLWRQMAFHGHSNFSVRPEVSKANALGQSGVAWEQLVADWDSLKAACGKLSAPWSGHFYANLG